MRALPSPFDAIAAGGPAVIEPRGTDLLNRRLLTKDLAFPMAERDAFGLHGLLPARVLSIEDQVALELEHLRRKDDDLERYIGLAALQDRNATLFYRLLTEHLEEFLPIVYTPVVGRATQEFSHILRRTRGIWITPADRDRVAEVLRSAPFEDVRLIVVTDNERILGLGDQGAGGMAIPIGKLALYSAACGIHPSVTLPVSLDVGTDNQHLLADPLYVGHRAPRLRGPAYDELVEAFVDGVREVWPGCLVQWEDFKHHNALQLLDRYRERVPSFNDDVQGTAAVVVGGVLAGMRTLGRAWHEQRIVLAGAGAAGIGIARLLALAMREAGLEPVEIARQLVLVDSRGLVHAAREDIDDAKRAFALPVGIAAEAGLPLDPLPGLEAVVAAWQPTVLVGTTGVPGSFTERTVRLMAASAERPIVLPLSNPTAMTEAVPSDILDWTDGRALVATGSPFEAVERPGRRCEVAQANNAFVFPGVGLGVVAAEARRVTDRMFLVAAQTLAAAVSPERLEGGCLFPAVSELREVSRRIAIAVAAEAVHSGHAGIDHATDLEALIDRAMWWPDYVPYVAAPGGRSGTSQ